MANENVNKVIYGGTTLIDLTADTITAADLQSGVTAHDKSGASITGTNTYDSDTSDDTAVVAEILSGKTAHARGAQLTGTMPNNGGTNVTVSTVVGTTIPLGYSDGSAKAVIDSSSASALIAQNIRENITILGVTGSMSGSEGVNPQSKTVTPTAAQQVITPDAPTYNYLAQVTVSAIPYTETDNAAGGKTVTIAS